MPSIEWLPASERPPARERLLLIVGAAGSPPDAQLMGKSELLIGYWTGSMFHLMDRSDLGSSPPVKYWAKISHVLPKEIELRPERRFVADVRD